MRLCVVSLNPAIDAEWRVDDVLWEEKNVVHSQRRWPGGKGVNVARWLQFLGAKVEVLMPLGGSTGREMRRGLRQWRIPVREIPITGETRVNVVVTTSAGRQMRFNPPGPRLLRTEWERVLATAETVVRDGAALLLSGALPPGAPADAYARLIRLAQRHNAPAFLDCDGAALVSGAKAKPFLVKPNLHELSRWAGRNLRSKRAARDAAVSLSEETGHWVLVSLGRDGATLVNYALAWTGEAAAESVEVMNTVGAGDAMLAAAANSVMRGEQPADWLRAGVIAATAAVQTAAGRMPTKSLLRNATTAVSVGRFGSAK